MLRRLYHLIGGNDLDCQLGSVHGIVSMKLLSLRMNRRVADAALIPLVMDPTDKRTRHLIKIWAQTCSLSTQVDACLLVTHVSQDDACA